MHPLHLRNRFIMRSLFVPLCAVALLTLAACASTGARSSDEKIRMTLDDPEAWRSTQPAPGPIGELVTPTFERFTLDNGLTVLVSQRHDLPLVSIDMAFRAGSAADPDGKEGLAQLTYQLLLEGAGERDAEALDNAFADLGTSIGSSVGQDGALIGTQVLTRNLDAAAALLADVVLRPRLEVSSFQVRKEQLLSNLAYQVGSPGYLAGEAFAATIFGEHHPYGRLGSGTPESVSSLTHADATGFYRGAAGPNGAALILAGDITTEDARALAERFFGKWEGKAKPTTAPEAPSLSERTQVFFVPKEGLAQTLIMVGRPGIHSGHDDEFHLNLASAIFGGFFGSRLNMNLREDKGYTYGARASLDPRLGVGPLTASSSVRADVTGASLAEFFNEFNALKTAPITEKELEAAREGLIRRIPGSFETVGGLASAAANLFFKDLPLDRYQRMVEAYEGATIERVQEVAEAYFDPAKMQIVLVGDPALIQEQVGEMGLGQLSERLPVKEAASK